MIYQQDIFKKNGFYFYNKEPVFKLIMISF